MIRIGLFLIVFSLLILQLIDRVYLRSMTAAKDPVAVSVKEGRVFALPLETQEIINTQSVNVFAEQALVKMFNFRPGKDYEHINSDEIKALFIDEKYYLAFKEQFLVWSSYEFRVNNISIKEAVTTDGTLVITPAASSSGARIWRYRALLPIMDRGVGGNRLSSMKVSLSMVYLGPEGGMGIYAVELSS